MKVFISWSGERSRAVADLLEGWLQCVLQALEPWMSSKDIDRGSLWFSEISDQLKDTRIGIVCLTQENKEKPWILFESGALAKGLSSSRICTLLIDLNPEDVENPLAQFNHTMPTREGMYELVRTLNASLGEQSLRDKVLEQVFDTYWPQFEDGFRNALQENVSSEPPQERSEDSLLVEVLRTVRTLDRRIRHLEKPTLRSDNLSRRYREPDYVRRKVEGMIADGIDPEVVEESLAGYAPPSFIKRTIISALEDMMAESEADSARNEPC